MCGEQAVCLTSWCRMSGSPPRVRGTAGGPHAHRRRGGITPACAGNSRRTPCASPPRWDHPRVCGEQTLITQLFKGVGGSPPRVRGTDSQSLAGYGYGRITPACAGNSFMAYSTAMLTQDHPRVCGEQVSFAACWHSRLGSPPRVRGTASSSMQS